LRAFRDLLREAVARVEEGIREGRGRGAIAADGLSARWNNWERVIPITRFLETVYDGLQDDTVAVDCEAACVSDAIGFIGGRWWDGQTFREETFWAVDGWLTRKRPPGRVRTMDLKGGFVIPPLADAHTHRLAHAGELAIDRADHRKAGVFYAMNMDPMLVVDAALLGAVGGPCGVDVAYTEGVITPSWSTVTDFYRTMVTAGRFGPGVRLADLQGEVIHVVDDAQDLEAAWPRLLARNPTFLKVILAFSDEWEERRGNPEYPANLPRGSAKPGLDPDLLPEIVYRAHTAGIRVAAHIETAADFRRAVEAGVDIVAHLPGSWQIGETAGYPDGDLAPWLLTPADAREAAERGVAVVTTAWADPADPRREALAAIHSHNVSLLAQSGVRLALGSDGAPGSTLTEVLYLARLGELELTPREIINIATRGTARVIFPGRRIGRLDDGYEASFVVLGGDPLADLANLERVSLVVKDGVPAEVCSR
jgi:hypothetical protein